MSEREPELDTLAPEAGVDADTDGDPAEAPDTPGIHHLSVVSGDPHGTVTFYRDVLGLRLVKRTVNHDEPAVHHLYFGDREATPGTTFTAFPYPLTPGGRRGAGQPSGTAFAIPDGSREYWRDRLAEYGVDADASERFGEPTLRFTDRDGLDLALVESADAGTLGVDNVAVSPWGERVPAEHAIRGMHSTTLRSNNPYATARVLELFGFGLVGQEAERVRYVAGADGVETDGIEADTTDLARAPTPGTGVDLFAREEPWAKEGAGTGHHVALRVPDRAALDAWHDRLVEAGLGPSQPRDRYYFRSVYVRDPGGVLFELATDGPGITRDEPIADLGSDLRLPPWLREDEAMLREQLPPLDNPVRDDDSGDSDTDRPAAPGGNR
ncbi:MULTISPECIES: VOC family protein [Halolamina]|uniref:Glyoxalase family protein n=1 Tax=Halolamina pelagica TaxID=699431 RepID=A0A1I5NQD8_9EURY|nr:MULTISPECIES: VOC family protein [Halolamina]NHX36430.1 ring-cleaving dioxygenase [Halolamina sp. R1-12]SFP24039.1 glyoxalase family protein [Halolamina pelagica]